MISIFFTNKHKNDENKFKEDDLLKNIVAISEKIKTKKNKEERDITFKEDLDYVDGFLKNIKGIIANKCRIMNI